MAVMAGKCVLIAFSMSLAAASPTPACPSNCEAVGFDPLCGQDGGGTRMSFLHSCHLELENCSQGTDYTKIYPGCCMDGERLNKLPDFICEGRASNLKSAAAIVKGH